MSVSTTTLCNLSASLWLELICKPQLESIEDYIRLIQTCRFFWSDNPVFQERRKELEKRVFSIYPKSCWNVLYNDVYNIYLPKSGLFLFYQLNPKYQHSVYFCGIFSSKKRLLTAFYEIVNLDENTLSRYSIESRYISIEMTTTGSEKYLIVSPEIEWELKNLIINYNLGL